jgi:chromosome segregation ATPase
MADPGPLALWPQETDDRLLLYTSVQPSPFTLSPAQRQAIRDTDFRFAARLEDSFAAWRESQAEQSAGSRYRREIEAIDRARADTLTRLEKTIAENAQRRREKEELKSENEVASNALELLHMETDTEIAKLEDQLHWLEQPIAVQAEGMRRPRTAAHEDTLRKLEGEAEDLKSQLNEISNNLNPFEAVIAHLEAAVESESGEFARALAGQAARIAVLEAPVGEDSVFAVAKRVEEEAAMSRGFGAVTDDELRTMLSEPQLTKLAQLLEGLQRYWEERLSGV